MKSALLLYFCSLVLSASELPTLEQIKNSQEAPSKILATGKRESLEPQINGSLNGKARYYHPNGQLYGIIEWRDGKKVGSHILYRENGSVEQFLSYHEGKLHGVLLNVNTEEGISEVVEFAVVFQPPQCLATV